MNIGKSSFSPVEAMVSIVILTYNSEHYIQNCVQSCLRQNYENTQIIIIDNDSKDSTKKIILDLIKTNPQKIKFLPLSRNTGFAAGMNKGISISDGDYILCLNPDMALESNYIQNSLRYFNNQQIGCVTGKIYRMEPSDKIDAVGNFLNFRFSLQNSKLISKRYYCFGSNGCAPFFRKKMIRDCSISGQFFDESYFAFMEDTDIAWRAQLFGWKTLYIPQSIAFHKRSATFEGKVSFFSKPENIQKLVLINRYKNILKNFNPITLFLLLPFFIFSETLIWFTLLIRSRKYFSFIKICLIQLITERKNISRWRNQIQSKRIKSDLYIFKFLRI